MESKLKLKQQQKNPRNKQNKNTDREWINGYQRGIELRGGQNG